MSSTRPEMTEGSAAVRRLCARCVAALGALVAATAISAPSASAAWAPSVAAWQRGAFVDSLSLAAGSDGRLLASWGYSSRRVSGGVVMSRRPDGAWGAPRTIGTTASRARSNRVTGTGGALQSLTAFGADHVIAIISRRVGRHGERQEWWAGSTTGRLHRAGIVPGRPWTYGTVVAFPDGAAVSGWPEETTPGDKSSNLRPRVVRVATRHDARSAFSTPRRISPKPPPPPYGHGLGPKLSATSLTIATGGARAVAAAWEREGVVEARVSRDRGRTWGDVSRLGPAAHYPSLAVAVSARGTAIVAWTNDDIVGARRLPTVRVAQAHAGQPFSTRVLEDLAVAPSSGSVAVAVRSTTPFAAPLHGYVARSTPAASFGGLEPLPYEGVMSLRVAAVRGGWVAAAVTRRSDGAAVQAAFSAG